MKYCSLESFKRWIKSTPIETRLTVFIPWFFNSFRLFVFHLCRLGTHCNDNYKSSYVCERKGFCRSDILCVFECVCVYVCVWQRACIRVFVNVRTSKCVGTCVLVRRRKQTKLARRWFTFESRNNSLARGCTRMYKLYDVPLVFHSVTCYYTTLCRYLSTLSLNEIWNC